MMEYEKVVKKEVDVNYNDKPIKIIQYTNGIIEIIGDVHLDYDDALWILRD